MAKTSTRFSIHLTCFDESPALPASQRTTVRAFFAGTVSSRGYVFTTAATSAGLMPTSSSITHGALDLPLVLLLSPPPVSSLTVGVGITREQGEQGGVDYLVVGRYMRKRRTLYAAL